MNKIMRRVTLAILLVLTLASAAVSQQTMWALWMSLTRLQPGSVPEALGSSKLGMYETRGACVADLNAALLESPGDRQGDAKWDCSAGVCLGRSFTCQPERLPRPHR